jgi:hypothetical protein
VSGLCPCSSAHIESPQFATTGAMRVAPYGSGKTRRTDLAFRALARLSSVDEKEIPR